jgi:hypothetical protein
MNQMQPEPSVEKDVSRSSHETQKVNNEKQSLPSVEKDALIREERWVPVAESGERWAPRDKDSAFRCMETHPAGGHYVDGAPWDGVTRIEHEIRYVTEWRVFPPGEGDN